ncbi:protein neprosin-like [Castanea sativa]|uniref:protein neprosin-like n=1 Tax=Castanea sativa TaxID=21020 RepID=UPI003F64F416
MALLVFDGGVDVKAEARKTLSEIDKKLKLLNKPAIKSIKSEDGDIIDCVDIYKQPAFDHPALRNHTIQMRPNTIFASETSTTKHESSPAMLTQTWQKSGSCPKGTVAIRRVKRKELLKADSLEHFGRDGPRTSFAVNTSKEFIKKNTSNDESKFFECFPAPEHSYANLYAVGNNFIGARGDINLWNPLVESYDEITSAQISLKSGFVENFESIEAGWMLDGYRLTGCINLNCAGFVHTSLVIALGATFTKVSKLHGPQFQINLRIDHDPITNHWWLQICNEVVGYWPAEILQYLKEKASIVAWGGDVYSKYVKPGHPYHTTAYMGSGEAASELFGSANFITNIRIIDDSLQLKYPDPAFFVVDEPNCYSALIHKADCDSEPYFYFGGHPDDKCVYNKK